MRISPLAGRVLASNLRQPRDRQRSRTVSFWPDVRDISDVLKCEGFSDAADEGGPHTPTGGVREAPRHEIAGVGVRSSPQAPEIRSVRRAPDPEEEVHAMRVWHGS